MKKAKNSKSASNQLSKRRSEEVIVDIHIHPLVISQARAFANLCRSISIGIQDNGTHGELLAYLVNAGLSIELYLKALMIAARSGRVTKGHDLDVLYKEFPDFLSDFLEFSYTARRPTDGWKYSMHALKFSAAQPKVPNAHPAQSFIPLLIHCTRRKMLLFVPGISLKRSTMRTGLFLLMHRCHLTRLCWH